MTHLYDQRSDGHSFERAASGVVATSGMPGKAVDDSGLDKQLTELLTLRVSQLNGCAFCLPSRLNIGTQGRAGTD